MTVIEIQQQLEALGYSPGPLDGLYGPLTQAAVRAFQSDQGLESDGIPGPRTQGALASAAPVGAQESRPQTTTGSYSEAEEYLGNDGYYRIPKNINVRLTKNFWSDEFKCQGNGCCTITVIYKPALLIWQAIRDDIGEPLEVVGAGGSGYRCGKHNASVNGAANSLHLQGAAADLHYKNPVVLKTAALRHVKDGEIGLYKWGCHVGRWERGYVSQFNG